MPEPEDDLIALVKGKDADQEHYYLDHGPNKHEQEAHVETGTAVISMNVGLLTDWLDDEGMGSAWEALDRVAQRKVWEASSFHFGIYSYDDEDADFYWRDKTPKPVEPDDLCTRLTETSKALLGDMLPGAGLGVTFRGTGLKRGTIMLAGDKAQYQVDVIVERIPYSDS